MTKYVHLCLIVPADVAPLARQLAEELAGPPGAGMFITGLSPTGQTPITHYVSSGMIEDTFINVLQDAEALYSVVSSYIDFETCEDILNRSLITDMKGLEAISSVHLKLIQTDLLNEE